MPAPVPGSLGSMHATEADMRAYRAQRQTGSGRSLLKLVGSDITVNKFSPLFSNSVLSTPYFLSRTVLAQMFQPVVDPLSRDIQVVVDNRRGFYLDNLAVSQSFEDVKIVLGHPIGTVAQTHIIAKGLTAPLLLSDEHYELINCHQLVNNFITNAIYCATINQSGLRKQREPDPRAGVVVGTQPCRNTKRHTLNPPTNRSTAAHTSRAL